MLTRPNVHSNDYEWNTEAGMKEVSHLQSFLKKIQKAFQYASLRINKKKLAGTMSANKMEKLDFLYGEKATWIVYEKMKRWRKQCSTSCWLFYSLKMPLDLLPPYMCSACVYVCIFHMYFYSQLTTYIFLTHVQGHTPVSRRDQNIP